MFGGSESEPREPKEKSLEDEARSHQPERGHPVAGEDIGSPEGGPGGAKGQSTEPISEEGVKGQTQVPAPDDEVGKPDSTEEQDRA
jgi:hypothetical protein